MSLFGNIKNYINFSHQTNFDANSQPKTSEEAARKAGYHGKVEKTEADYFREGEAKKAKPVEVTKVEAKPEVAPVTEDKSALDAFNKQRAAAAEKEGKEIVASLRGGNGDTSDLKAKPTEPETKVNLPEVAVNAKPSSDKYDKFVTEHGDLAAKATPNPDDKYNKFVNEHGSLQAKATPKPSSAKIPWDKSDVATGRSWKNGAGQTIKSYRDKDGNIYIRGKEGKVVLFDAQGNPSKLARSKYRTMAKAFRDAGSDSAVASNEGNSVAPNKRVVAGIDYKKMHEATKNAVPADNVKR